MSANDDGWEPQTRLGRKVQAGEITSMRAALNSGLPLKEPELVDQLLPGLEDEVLDINMVQRMTDSGRRVKFRCVVAIGNRDGYLGYAEGRDDQVGGAIEKAIDVAKLNIIAVDRGSGSWEDSAGGQHPDDGEPGEGDVQRAAQRLAGPDARPCPPDPARGQRGGDRVMRAVVQLRGTVHMNGDQRDTLELLNLGQVNHATLVPERETYDGMVAKVNDFVAFGEPGTEALATVLERRAEPLDGEGDVDEAYLEEHADYDDFGSLAAALIEEETTLREQGLSPTLRLHPPRGGHDGIKHPANSGRGVLGEHEDIDDLLEAMR